MRSISALPLAMFAATGLLLGTSAVSGQEPAADGVVRITDTPTPQSDPISNGTVEGDSVYDQCSGDCEGRRGCGLYQNGECVSPDHGWCRPIKYPIRRMPVQYYSYWPARWYGEPGSGIAPNAPRFPVVYTPTDTTQLGVYYQRVPQWLPNPAMIPPAPWPTDWHNRQCANGYGCGAQGAAVGIQPQPSAQPAPMPPAPIQTEVPAPNANNGGEGAGRIRS